MGRRRGEMPVSAQVGGPAVSASGVRSLWRWKAVPSAESQEGTPWLEAEEAGLRCLLRLLEIGDPGAPRACRRDWHP